MTPRGDRVYRSLLKRVEKAQEDMLARLDAEERRQLMALMRKAIAEDLSV